MVRPSAINCVGNDESLPYGIDPEKTAIAIIDMQPYQIGDSLLSNWVDKMVPGFKSYVSDRVKNLMVPNMNRLIDYAHKTGIRVLATRYVAFEEDGSDLSRPCQEINEYSLKNFGQPMIPVKGSQGTEVISEIRLSSEDFIIEKNGSSMFIGNHLHDTLRDAGINHLILTGVLTNCCISSSARQAWDTGYYVTVISDACAGFSPQWHDMELDNLSFGYTRNLSCARFFDHIEKT